MKRIVGPQPGPFVCKIGRSKVEVPVAAIRVKRDQGQDGGVIQFNYFALGDDPQRSGGGREMAGGVIKANGLPEQFVTCLQQ